MGGGVSTTCAVERLVHKSSRGAGMGPHPVCAATGPHSHGSRRSAVAAGRRGGAAAHSALLAVDRARAGNRVPSIRGQRGYVGAAKKTRINVTRPHNGGGNKPCQARP